MMSGLFAPLPDKKYEIIYADPPWPIVSSTPAFCYGGGPRKHIGYDTVPLGEIASLPVDTIAADNSILFLWTIQKFIEQSFHVARTWGFKPVSMLTWAKNPIGFGLGGAFGYSTEFLLYCRKGKPKHIKKCNTTWFNIKRPGRHSKKPQFFRDLIVETFGDLSRIELFARERFPGWDAWGDEV